MQGAKDRREGIEGLDAGGIVVCGGEQGAVAVSAGLLGAEFGVVAHVHADEVIVVAALGCGVVLGQRHGLRGDGEGNSREKGGELHLWNGLVRGLWRALKGVLEVGLTVLDRVMLV
jgi:hypothetical protein